MEVSFLCVPRRGGASLLLPLVGMVVVDSIELAWLRSQQTGLNVSELATKS